MGFMNSAFVFQSIYIYIYNLKYTKKTKWRFTTLIIKLKNKFK